MESDEPASSFPEDRSLEDELRSQFGSEVLVANDELDAEAATSHGDGSPPEDLEEDGTANIDEDEVEEMDDDFSQPIDLRATGDHALSDSDDEPSVNPLRRLIHNRVSSFIST
jgi:hypothetical protein